MGSFPANARWSSSVASSAAAAAGEEASGDVLGRVDAKSSRSDVLGRVDAKSSRSDRRPVSASAGCSASVLSSASVTAGERGPEKDIPETSVSSFTSSSSSAS